MKNKPLSTPVLFIIFNREDTVRQVFEEIRKAKPEQLFIAADGARADKPGEAERCEAVRQVVVNGIDWKCDVKTLFQDKNLGCGLGVKTAIDWFFEDVEEGIILEDDCLPHQDFFLFCQELLEYYRDDTRISCISGNNFQFGKKYDDTSYYFSRYSNTWGWATWRRAWNLFDFDMKTFPEFKKRKDITQLFPYKYVQRRWENIFEKVYNKDSSFSAWDIQWTYTAFSNKTLSITPQVNMVSNIGVECTHEMSPELMNIPTLGIEQIKHPPVMLINTAADQILFDKAIADVNVFIKIYKKVRKLLRKVT